MKAVVTAPLAPMYRNPREGAELVDELLCGMTAELLMDCGDYVYLRTPYRYEGYAPSYCLSSARYQDWSGCKVVQTTAPFLDALAEARIQAPRLLTVPRGSYLGIAAPARDGWQELILPDGRWAWARASHLSALPVPWQERGEQELRRAIAASALSYLGCQYRWGGKTPEGIDCSGLSSMAYLLNGVKIHRDASLAEGFPLVSVAQEQLDIADLLFFRGHVALYLGKGRYIHATGRAGSDGVVINSLKHEDSLYRQDLAEGILQIGSLYPRN